MSNAGQQVLWEVDYSIRTGPKLEDYELVKAGAVINPTDAMRRFNVDSDDGACLFDLDPAEQSSRFGKVLCRVGDFPGSDGSDPHSRHWYRPLVPMGEYDPPVKPTTGHSTQYSRKR